MNKPVGTLRICFSVRSGQEFTHSILLEVLTPITSDPTSRE